MNFKKNQLIIIFNQNKYVIKKRFLLNKFPYPIFSLLIIKFLSNESCPDAHDVDKRVCNIEQVLGTAEICSDMAR